MRRRRKQAAGPEGVQGGARGAGGTKDLAKRIGRGDVAVIDHRDIDRVAAESLIAAGVAAVVNADRSISGRYPNGGPLRIVQAGIPLLDDVGPAVMEVIRDGDAGEVRDGAIWRDAGKIATGDMPMVDDIEVPMEAAGARIGVELRRFAVTTLEYVEKEAELTFEPLELPPLDVKMRGRHAVVVVRGHDYKHDLHVLRPYIKEYRPVL